MANATSSSGFNELAMCPYLQGYVWQRKYLTKGSYKHLVVVTSINFVSVVPTVLLNALVIFAVVTRHQLRRSKSTILLGCLAGADLLTGLVGQPIRIAAELQRILNTGTSCNALEKVSFLTFAGHSFATLGHLVLITIDRYIAIKKPLRYRDIVTSKRITTGVLTSWTVTMLAIIQEIILASINNDTKLYQIYMNIWTTTALVIASVSIIFIVGNYCYIFSETRRQQRLQTEHLTEDEVARIRKNNKSVKTLGMILGALILTYLPIIIFIVIIYSTDVEPHVMTILLSWIATFTMLGSLVNPVIYCWRMPKLRQAFLEILCLRQPETDNQPPKAIEMQIIHPH